MPWEQWAENTDHIYISQFFQFFSEVIELNKFILKGLKLPGVHVHPFPLLFGNTQRGVQPKLGALRLAPLEILRAKLSNQAAIQQGPAPLPVNHRLSSSSGNRDTVWKIHWWMTREEFMLKWTEKRFLLSEKRVSEDLSRSGYVQATKSLRRCKESSCRKIIRVCWDERRKNNVQPTDSGFFPSLKTDGALLLLRLKPFFVSLLYIFCPSSTNSLMQRVKLWELEPWQGIFSCPGLQDGEQRGDEPPVAGYYWVEMNSLTFHTRLWLPGIYVFYFNIQYVELFSVNWVRPELWCGGKLTDWHCEEHQRWRCFRVGHTLNVWWGQRWCESYARVPSPTRRAACHLRDSSRMYSTRFLIRPVDAWFTGEFRRLFSFKGCCHRHPAGRWDGFISS